jgi:hypothetical protein
VESEKYANVKKINEYNFLFQIAKVFEIHHNLTTFLHKKVVPRMSDEAQMKT